jgi:hypothetical protein
MSDLDRYRPLNLEGEASLTCGRAIEQLKECRTIPEAQVREICYKARELLIEEGNVVMVNAPVTVGVYAHMRSLGLNGTDMR